MISSGQFEDDRDRAAFHHREAARFVACHEIYEQALLACPMWMQMPLTADYSRWKKTWDEERDAAEAARARQRDRASCPPWRGCS